MKNRHPYETPRKSYHEEMRQSVVSAQKRLEAAQAELKSISTKDQAQWFAQVTKINSLHVDVATAKSRIENYNTGKHVPEIYALPRN